MDRELVSFVYDHLFAQGRPPRSSEIAAHFHLSVDQAKDRVRTLNIGKTILPDARGEIWMAGPFGAESRGHSVTGRRVTWQANCAWDALAIGILAGEKVRIG